MQFQKTKMKVPGSKNFEYCVTPGSPLLRLKTSGEL